MIPSVAVFLALVLVGLPLVVAPSWVLAVVAAASAALAGGGIAARSVPVVTAGATLATVEYAVALWLSAGPPDILTAMVFGTALLLLVQTVEFMGRTRGAVLGVGVTAAVVRHWLAIAAAGIGVIATIAAGAAVAMAIPLPSHPASAVVGALGAFVAAVATLKLVTTSDG